jgi:quinolinate synthase
VTAFPSLVIRADELVPEGAFAEAQADFLEPDPETVKRLDALLREKNAGIVAHFYMDPELQGVLSACSWPHVHISDSLAMADAGIRMAEAGVERIVVLGVDFMSENVRAMLDATGHQNVEVLRAVPDPIGCSLAASAESRAYEAWLRKAAATPRSLHVVYINTSLHTKALAHSIVPTITCTSSNVVKTILQAAAQIPDVHVWYGPDTYMGQNLATLLSSLTTLDEAAVRAIHPEHTPETIRAFLPRFHWFEQGVCIVHHMFGAEVTERVRRDYADAYITAHLEVPGEMFALGWEAQRRGKGVVGSTSNILGFISDAVKKSDRAAGPLRFVLGTEAGMITSIVRQVQRDLRARPDASDVAAEIVFPVASEAIARSDDVALPVVPGVAAGEGCGVAGGCATCPYMKMNSLDATLDVLARSGTGEDLSPYHPKSYTERIAGRTAADLGGEPILHMRHFSKTGRLPDALVTAVSPARR